MTAWLSLGISLAAVAVGIIFMRRMIDRRAGSDVVLDEIRREVGAILTEMNQTTERNIELVEDSIERLRKALDDADRRLGVLRRETRKNETSGVVYSHLSGAARAMPSRAETPEPAITQTVHAEQPAVMPAVQTAPPTPVSVESAAEGAAEEKPEVPLKERVLALYRQGIPIERIAARVGTAVSEIELIVSLSERR